MGLWDKGASGSCPPASILCPVEAPSPPPLYSACRTRLAVTRRASHATVRKAPGDPTTGAPVVAWTSCQFRQSLPLSEPLFEAVYWVLLFLRLEKFLLFPKSSLLCLLFIPKAHWLLVKSTWLWSAFRWGLHLSGGRVPPGSTLASCTLPGAQVIPIHRATAWAVVSPSKNPQPCPFHLI